MNLSDDTIAAISTPPGRSGIGIVRMSGPHAISIAAGVFFPKKDADLFKMPSHSLRYGFIKNEKSETIDEVLITVMHRPSTYTREDIVEINAHGGIVPLGEILRLLLRKGARLAQPGEFTKRAFLNGRIDIAQAEAVADFIRAKTLNQARIAMRQLEGVLSDEILEIKSKILDLVVRLEASIDFPDEELELDSGEKLLEELKFVKSKIEHLLSQAERARLVQEGVKVVITGRPNVGKSSLLNTLLSKERAIVTPFPGTTRDTVEDEIEVEGNLVRLIDTAGLCSTEDPLEKEAIKRTRLALKDADMVIFLLDASTGIVKEDREIFSSLDGKKVLLAINKIDLPSGLNPEDVSTHFPGLRAVPVSATNMTNIDRLVKEMSGMLWDGNIEQMGTEIIVSLRHEEIIRDVHRCLSEAISGFEQGRSEEYISMDLRNAMSYLSEITGEVYTEDILERIFSRFCIGK